MKNSDVFHHIKKHKLLYLLYFVLLLFKNKNKTLKLTSGLKQHQTLKIIFLYFFLKITFFNKVIYVEIEYQIYFSMECP